MFYSAMRRLGRPSNRLGRNKSRRFTLRMNRRFRRWRTRAGARPQMIRSTFRCAFEIPQRLRKSGFEFRQRRPADLRERFQPRLRLIDMNIRMGQFLVREDFRVGSRPFGLCADNLQPRFMLLQSGLELLLISVS
jgi:hypothetical protein